MKKKNLLLTLAMLPTMLLGVTALASCGSNTKYNAENAITRRANGVGIDKTKLLEEQDDISVGGVRFGKLKRITEIVDASDAAPFIYIDSDNSINASNYYFDSFRNVLDQDYTILSALQIPESFGTLSLDEENSSGCEVVVEESPAKLTNVSGVKTWLIKIRGYDSHTHFNLKLSNGTADTSTIKSAFEDSTSNVKMAVFLGSARTYENYTDFTYSSGITLSDLKVNDTKYKFSDILKEKTGSYGRLIDTSKLMISKDGKAIIELNYPKKTIDSLNLCNIDFTPSNEDSPEKSDNLNVEIINAESNVTGYVKKYIIFDSTAGDVKLFAHLQSFNNISSSDENTYIKVCTSNTLEYEEKNPLSEYGNMTAIGEGMQLENVFVDNDGQKFYFDPAKINVPTSKDGKKIVKFVSWKHFDAFRLNTTVSYDYNLSDIELIETGDDIDGDYTTRYLIYPASITSKICLEAFISGSLTPCNTFFDEADPEICLVKACRASNLEYDDQIKDGGTKTIVINVDSHYSEEDIISQVSAIDLFGVSVPVTKVSSDYVVGKTGKFNIVLSATDSYGQTSKATLICDVRDYSAPTITQKNAEIKYDYGTLLTEAKLLENFVLADNMGVEGLKTKFIYPTGFEISKALVFGSYNLTLEVTDAFNNKATKSFTLSVVDNVAPVISKVSGDIGDKIKISYSTIGKNTINTILGYFKATDAIDGDCEIYLKDGKIPSEMAGDFTLKIGAKDKSGNEAIYTINCEVVADLPPVFILSDKLVNATISNPLDLTDLQNIVQKAILKKTVNNLQINASGYLANSDKVGSYPVSYTYYDDNMEVQSGAFTLQVTEDLPVAKEDNYFVNAFKTVFKHVTEATATQWIVVIATFLIPILLIGFIANYVMKCIDKAKKEEEMKKAKRKSNSKNYKRKW